jgi:hypothetical protein
MLDGLDEVGDSDSRRLVWKWVEKQMLSYGNNFYMITSRPFGYRDNPQSCATTYADLMPAYSMKVSRLTVSRVFSLTVNKNTALFSFEFLPAFLDESQTVRTCRLSHTRDQIPCHHAVRSFRP